MSPSVLEQAKQELEILELHHPGKFQYLKMELKTLISDFESQKDLVVNATSISTCPSALTQESSSNAKKRKKGDVVVVEVSKCRLKANDGNFMKRKRGNKTDAILERAQECISKIQLFKTYF